MGSTTSSDYHRCSFDASDSKSWHALVSCVICRRATLCAKMIKCVVCCRSAHKKCIKGALRSDQRDGQKIAAKSHCSPASFGTWTADELVMTGDSSAHTKMTVCDIACSNGGVTSAEGCTQTCMSTAEVEYGNGEFISVERCMQTCMSTTEVACGNARVTSAERCTQTCMSTTEVACGDGGVTSAEGFTQTLMSTVEVACGNGKITSAEEYTQTCMSTTEVACGNTGVTSKEECTQTCMSTAEVACGNGEVTSAEGCTQTLMSTVEVACGNGKITSAEEYTQTCMSTTEVACGDSEVTSAEGCTQTCMSTAEMACGNTGVTSKEECTQTCMSTADVACGNGEVTSEEECTQTCMSIAEVACGDDTSSVNSFTQTNVAVRHVASGIEAEYVDGYSQASVATSDIVCGSDAVHVQCSTQTRVAVRHAASTVGAEHVTGSTHADVPKKLRTMADMMAEMFNTDTSTTTTSTATPPTTPHTSTTAPVQSNENAQKTQLYRTHKYWKQRYTLFSKFDEGIMLNEVGLISTCPEVLAQHMAKKCSVHTVLDPFCGSGGNAIQLALTCHHVIAIDVDPRNIALAKKNAEVYGVADRINFIVGDSFLEAVNLRVDAIVTSPPRGKPAGGERRTDEFDARELCSRESGGMSAILRMARAASAPKVLLNVPKNIIKAQCMQIATKEGSSRVRYESIFIDGRPNSVNLYVTLRNDFSDRRALIHTSTEVNLSTPPLFERQIMECARDNDMSVYTSYLDWVTRFLDTNN